MIYFANNGTIDLAAVTTMGVSVKEIDSPIGYFGTGLKFAIATLLRTGHTVTLYRNGETIQFEARATTIRGERFDIVCMDDQPLAFTTALGRNWEPWQAYRELRSNALDEGGDVCEQCRIGEWDTVFAVRGDGIEQAHRERSKIFLEGAPLYASLMCEIRPGPSAHGFYRGIRAVTLPHRALLTYNLICSQTLTEDRTLADAAQIALWAADAITEIDDDALLERCLFAPEGTFEQSLHYSGISTPSEAFMRVVQRHAHNATINRSAVDLWKKKAKAEIVYAQAALDPFELMQMEDALDLCRRIGCNLTSSDFMVLEDLGEGTLGVARDGQILISRRVFDMGVRVIASTLYEEWLHAKHRKQDCSRDMQNFLFDKLFALVDKQRATERATASQ